MQLGDWIHWHPHADHNARGLWEQDWPYTIVACVSRDWFQPTYSQATAGTHRQGSTASWSESGDKFVQKDETSKVKDQNALAIPWNSS